MKRKLL